MAIVHTRRSGDSVVVTREPTRAIERFFALPEASWESQSWTDTHFEAQVKRWDELYDRDDVFSRIMQKRAEAVLGCVDSLRLAPGSRILEIGCGTGRTAVALSRRSFRVDAVDRVFGMLAHTRKNAVEAGVRPETGLLAMDAHQLAMHDASYSVVIACGLIPWLTAPDVALREMARVVQPGGHLILIDGNSSRLSFLLDPLHNPSRLLKPIKSAVKHVRQRITRGSTQRWPVTLRQPHEFDDMLADAGLEKAASTALGFGPFTFLGRKLLPDRLGVRLNDRLNRLAEERLPILRSIAAQYIVLARRPYG